mmetsp:Transcript_4964/g.7220  ORF Transcript_4964/g.7220 Transcript_4964/m.7220 type:complete len:303 (+) Transcript_4964:32-940(+)
MRIHEALSSSIAKMSHRSSKIFTHLPMETKTTKDDRRQQDADLKRRRRGSYARLRRSISESMLFHSSDSARNHEITGVNKMDVVLLKKSLSTSNNPGNVRFRILIEMQQDIFVTADQAEKQEILDDLIRTVQRHWQGRFLQKSLDGYSIVQQANLKQVLTNILVNKTSTAEPPSIFPASMPATEPISLFSTSINPEPILSIDILVPEPAPISDPSPILPVSQNQNSSNVITRAPILPDVESLRSAAVQGLKARQQKRQIMNRMGAGTKKNENGTSLQSNASMNNGIFLVMATTIAAMVSLSS